MRFILRKTNEDDYELVYSIKKNALGEYITKTWGWDEELQRKMQMEEFNTENISIIESDGAAIGTVGINEIDDDITISRLYIIDKYQSKGIGSKIIEDVISKNPHKKIRLRVLKVNNRARELYERLGFKVTGDENHHQKMEYIRNICLNCGEVTGKKFCPNCGQKSSIGRINMKQILHDFFNVFTHVDSGILYLIKEQFIRPGLVVKEYISGRRKKYFSPFQYLLLGVAAATFLTINLDLGLGLFGNVSVNIEGEEGQLFVQNFVRYVYRYVNIFMLVSVPFMAVYSRFLFRKSGYNYAEHLALNTFVSGQRHLLFILAVPFLFFFRDQSRIIINIFYIIWVIFFVWTYIQFFDPKSKAWAIIKTIFISILFLITNGLIIGLVFYVFFRKNNF